jgi:hypothetical protein
MTPKSLWCADLDPGLGSINTERRRSILVIMSYKALSLHAIHPNLAHKTCLSVLWEGLVIHDPQARFPESETSLSNCISMINSTDNQEI